MADRFEVVRRAARQAAERERGKARWHEVEAMPEEEQARCRDVIDMFDEAQGYASVGHTVEWHAATIDRRRAVIDSRRSERDEAVASAVRQGMTISAASRRLGVPVVTAWRACKRLGVVPPKADPRESAWCREAEARRARVYEMRYRGVPADDVASAVGLTTSYVRWLSCRAGYYDAPPRTPAWRASVLAAYAAREPARSVARRHDTTADTVRHLACKARRRGGAT